MILSDAALLETWRQGDKQAASQLLDRYYKRVERFFLHKVKDGIEDLIQETFAACVAGRDQVRNVESFRSYLFAIAHNVLRGHLRRKMGRKDDLDFDAISVEDLAPGQSTLVERRQERRRMLEGLRRIPLSYQVLLEMHYWEELTTEEMAVVLEIPVGTVRGRLQRARQLFEEALARLSQSQGELPDTLSSLDDWARECRSELGAGERS